MNPRAPIYSTRAMAERKDNTRELVLTLFDVERKGDPAPVRHTRVACSDPAHAAKCIATAPRRPACTPSGMLLAVACWRGPSGASGVTLRASQKLCGHTLSLVKTALVLFGGADERHILPSMFTFDPGMVPARPSSSHRSPSAARVEQPFSAGCRRPPAALTVRGRWRATAPW
jgi:hypothetical protein